MSKKMNVAMKAIEQVILIYRWPVTQSQKTKYSITGSKIPTNACSQMLKLLITISISMSLLAMLVEVHVATKVRQRKTTISKWLAQKSLQNWSTLGMKTQAAKRQLLQRRL